MSAISNTFPFINTVNQFKPDELEDKASSTQTSRDALVFDYLKGLGKLQGNIEKKQAIVGLIYLLSQPSLTFQSVFNYLSSEPVKQQLPAANPVISQIMTFLNLNMHYLGKDAEMDRATRFVFCKLLENKEVKLAHEIGEGGEGTVYDILSPKEGVVAKVLKKGYRIDTREIELSKQKIMGAIVGSCLTYVNSLKYTDQERAKHLSEGDSQNNVAVGAHGFHTPFKPTVSSDTKLKSSPGRLDDLDSCSSSDGEVPAWLLNEMLASPAVNLPLPASTSPILARARKEVDKEADSPTGFESPLLFPPEEELASRARSASPRIATRKIDDVGLVMLKAEGSLSDYLKNETRFNLKLSGIIKAAHSISQFPYVHRDLKPANLLKVKNEFKVADISMSLKEGEKEKAAYATLLYSMPPETLQSGLITYTRKIDSWSLGIMLFETYLGEVPLVGYRNSAALEKLVRNNQYSEVLFPDFSVLYDKYESLSGYFNDHHEEVFRFNYLNAEVSGDQKLLKEVNANYSDKEYYLKDLKNLGNSLDKPFDELTLLELKQIQSFLKHRETDSFDPSIPKINSEHKEFIAEFNFFVEKAMNYKAFERHSSIKKICKQLLAFSSDERLSSQEAYPLLKEQLDTLLMKIKLD